MAATSRIEDAVGALLVLERRPDELREIEEARRYIRGQNIDDLTAQPEQESLEKWDRWRDDLLLAFETASLDLSSEPLRARLEQAQRALLYPYGPWDIERQPESVTRRIVCRHALECVGAFRRGDLLPAKPKKFTGTIGSVDEWVGWQEEQIRFEKEEWAKRRKSHNSSAAPPE